MNDLRASCVVVFDLDDTLYLEKDYQSSGFQELINLLCKLYQVDRYSLEKIVTRGGDVLQEFAQEIGCDSIKESLLWFYRLHSPDISLSPSVKSLLELLESKGVVIVILTDGRSITQRLKLVALGLDRYPFFISDEFGGFKKPDNKRFKLIEEDFPANKYIYVGDNVEKDFIAPNEMGWVSICLTLDPDFIQQYDMNDFPKINAPKNWIRHLTEIEDFL
ncbi:HAD family hydrolase [Candidatus Puniceispirillum sp.]|nr:HAD family hydrolase [Candidatus Puniceispirillum sp.]